MIRVLQPVQSTNHPNRLKFWRKHRPMARVSSVPPLTAVLPYRRGSVSIPERGQLHRLHMFARACFDSVDLMFHFCIPVFCVFENSPKPPPTRLGGPLWFSLLTWTSSLPETSCMHHGVQDLAQGAIAGTPSIVFQASTCGHTWLFCLTAK